MKKTLTLLAAFSIICILTLDVSAKRFTDVNDKEIYKTAIEFISEIGIANGHPDGSYKPLDSLNRAEMLKIIAEASITEGSTKDTAVFENYARQKCFKDLIIAAWYTKYICYGKAKGWVVGYENGKFFKPEQKVSFVEALKMSYKAFNIDFDENSEPWFRDLVFAAGEKNYIPHTIAAFHSSLQRNQMADMVTRIIKYAISPAELETYLGSRTDVVVTFETIERGQDLSKLEVSTLTP